LWLVGRHHLPLWKRVWWLLTKLNTLFPCGPAITFLGVYPSELEANSHTKTCTQMFTLLAAVFVVVKTWKQPRCPTIGEKINQCIHPL
jgi:hypothetical protein